MIGIRTTAGLGSGSTTPTHVATRLCHSILVWDRHMGRHTLRLCIIRPLTTPIRIPGQTRMEISRKPAQMAVKVILRAVEGEDIRIPQAVVVEERVHVRRRPQLQR